MTRSRTFRFSGGRKLICLAFILAFLTMGIPALGNHNVSGLTVAYSRAVPGTQWNAVTFDVITPTQLALEGRPTFGASQFTALGMIILREDGSFFSFVFTLLKWEYDRMHVYSETLGGAVLGRTSGSGAGYTSVTITSSQAAPAGRYTALTWAISQNAQTTETFLYAGDGKIEVLADSTDTGLFLARAHEMEGYLAAGARGFVMRNIPTVEIAHNIHYEHQIDNELLAFFGDPPPPCCVSTGTGGTTQNIGGGVCIFRVERPDASEVTGCPLFLSEANPGAYRFHVDAYAYAGYFASEPHVQGADWYLPVIP